MNDEDYMREALKEAEIALKEGDWPIGCVIELDGDIIARGHNQVNTLEDRMAHAEIMALRQARGDLFKVKQRATLYTTYEPCPMCLGTCVLHRIRRVVFGIDLDDSGATYLKEHFPACFNQDDDFNIEFTPGVLAEECYRTFMVSKLAQKQVAKGKLKLRGPYGEL